MNFQDKVSNEPRVSGYSYLEDSGSWCVQEVQMRPLTNQCKTSSDGVSSFHWKGGHCLIRVRYEHSKPVKVLVGSIVQE